jgi:hypothetical protein
VMPVRGQRQFQLKNKYSASCKFAHFLHALLEFTNRQGGAGKGTEAVPAKIDQFINANLHIFFHALLEFPNGHWTGCRLGL